MRAATFLAVAFAFALTATTTAAAEACADVAGDFVATTESPCLRSPVLLCTHGTLTGDLEASYDFVMTSQTLLADPMDPTYFTFTGTSVITLADGRMFAQDTGRMWARGTQWPFETTVNVEGGEGAWAGAVGQIVATGALDHERGVTEGEYVGRICRSA